MLFASCIRGIKSLSSANSTPPKFNFGAATQKLPILFGVEAPGTPKKPDGLYNENKSVPETVVTSWVDYLKKQNVKRTLCLLTPEELDCYADPGYKALLEEKGIIPSLVNVFEEGKLQIETFPNA